MPCFHPIPAWQFPNIKTETGKCFISLKDPYAPAGPERVAITLPCGRCDGCRKTRALMWSVRCVHEASLFDANCFITLTYNDFFIPDNGSLVKEDFVNFMKRLRKRIAPLAMASCYKSDHGRLKMDKFYSSFGVRFFHCGEYGAKLGRPHHHACLFNFDFPDRVLWKQKDGIRLYRSKMLDELWTDPLTGEQIGW